MRNSTSLALVATLAMAGCVKYRPRPLDPPRSEQRFRTRSLADPGLRTFLNRASWPPAKLGLNDLSAVALYFNPELDVARAQLRTARAAVITAGAKVNPSVSTGAGWENSPESPVVFHFDPTLTLVTAGKRGLRILESQKLAEAAQVQFADTVWGVKSRVRAAWVEYLISVQLRGAWRAETGLRAEIVSILEARLKVGEASRPDVELARTSLISGEVEAKAAETKVDEAAAFLASAIGLPFMPEIDSQPTPVLPLVPALAEVQQAGLLNRADVRKSLLDYAAAEAGLHLEIAKQYPDIDFSPGYSFDEGHHKFTFGPSFQIPLFNRNRGPIAEAEARRAEAEARFNAVQALAIGEFEIALARYRGARAELTEAEQRLVRIQQTREAAMRRAVQAGEEDRFALASVRLEGAAAERIRLEALRKAQSAWGALEDALQHSFEPGGDALPDPERKP